MGPGSLTFLGPARILEDVRIVRSDFKRLQCYREQAKRLILKLVCQAGRKGLAGRVRLYKAFYYAHLLYLLREGVPLTGWDLVHMPYGPGVEDGDELISELVEAQTLVATTERVGPYPTNRYTLGPAADRRQLKPASAVEGEIIEEAVKYVTGKTAVALSAELHEFSRSWLATSNGDPLDVALDTMTDEEYARLRLEAEAAKTELRAVWGE